MAIKLLKHTKPESKPISLKIAHFKLNGNHIDHPIKSPQIWIYLPNQTVIRTDNNLTLCALDAAALSMLAAPIQSLSLWPGTDVLPSNITTITTAPM